MAPREPQEAPREAQEATGAGGTFGGRRRHPAERRRHIRRRQYSTLGGAVGNPPGAGGTLVGCRRHPVRPSGTGAGAPSDNLYIAILKDNVLPEEHLTQHKHAKYIISCLKST